MCAGAPSYDLIYTEADSGSIGISVGETAAFVLDPRRDHLTASPGLRVRADHLWNQIPGKHVWAVDVIDRGNKTPFYSGPGGVFTITATGSGLAPFSFELIYGQLDDGTSMSRIDTGEIVVQEWGGGCGTKPPKSLTAPDFSLVQDASPSSLQKTQFAWMRRAYRAQRLTQLQLTGEHDYADGPCLPHDFPRYPSMQSTGGQSRTCTWDIDTNGQPDNVLSFYKSQLNVVSWRVISVDGSTIAFRRQDNDGYRGVVIVMPGGSVHISFAYADQLCTMFVNGSPNPTSPAVGL